MCRAASRFSVPSPSCSPVGAARPAVLLGQNRNGGFAYQVHNMWRPIGCCQLNSVDAKPAAQSPGPLAATSACKLRQLRPGGPCRPSSKRLAALRQQPLAAAAAAVCRLAASARLSQLQPLEKMAQQACCSAGWPLPDLEPQRPTPRQMQLVCQGASKARARRLLTMPACTPHACTPPAGAVPAAPARLPTARRLSIWAQQTRWR